LGDKPEEPEIEAEGRGRGTVLGEGAASPFPSARGAGGAL